MHKDKALQIIAENKKSYNAIASDFDVTRQIAWPEFELLLHYIKEGSRVLDIGCGNGRLFSFLNRRLPDSLQYVGVDQSEELIKIAGKNNLDADFYVADVLNLPFQDGEFDIVAGIAFLHHIPSQELREKCLKEIYRVLSPGGILFLTNWNLFRWEIISHNVKRNKMNPLHFFFPHDGMDAGDFWIPFQKQKRYYHHFTKRELKSLAEKAGFKLDSCQKGKNMIMILKKRVLFHKEAGLG